MIELRVKEPKEMERLTVKDQPRKYWEEYSVVELYKEHRGHDLVIIVGADDPSLLEKEEAMALAKKVAHKNGFQRTNGKGEIQVHGQNALATREFYYNR